MKKNIFKSAVLMAILSISLQQLCSAVESLAYLYGGTTSAYLSRLDQTGSNITIVSPDYFEVDESGSVVYTKEVDPVLIGEMKKRNITALPFLSNHWSRDNAKKMLQRRSEAALFLADAVVKHNLDGLDIDIQNITESDKDDFTDFIKILREKMPSGKNLTVCVPANPYFTTVGWQGAYDYAELSRHCDHIFIMTYDESYNGGPPGPVASYWFVENAIKYGLKYTTPDKLMIGIPLYGRFWTDSIKGAAFTGADIKWLIENADADVWYDTKKDCARATVTVPKGTSLTTWGGRVISEGVYDIWYDNERSYEKKLSLIRKYDLRGVGIWALGQEPREMWNNYASWVRGGVFSDIDGHWAQSYIISLYETGVVSGRDKTRFDPDSRLTRAEASVMLARMAGLETDDSASVFHDTSGHWASGYIEACRRADLINGVTAQQFQPDRPITREEFAAIADRYTSLDDTFDMTDCKFTDVTHHTWSIKSIIKMNINGVISGYPDGTFRPGDNITRAESAKILSRVNQLPTRFLKSGIIPLDRAPMSPR